VFIGNTIQLNIMAVLQVTTQSRAFEDSKAAHSLRPHWQIRDYYVADIIAIYLESKYTCHAYNPLQKKIGEKKWTGTIHTPIAVAIYPYHPDYANVCFAAVPKVRPPQETSLSLSFCLQQPFVHARINRYSLCHLPSVPKSRSSQLHRYAFEIPHEHSHLCPFRRLRN